MNSSPVNRIGGPKRRSKDAVTSSHGSALPLGLQLGGPLGRLERKAPTFQIAESGELDASDRTGVVSMIHKRNPLDYACSPGPRSQNTPPSTSRQRLGSARARFCGTRALHPAWCALTSGPSVDPVWAIGPPSSEPVALGVLGPHTGHRELPEALLRPLCTADCGRARTRSLREKWPPGPTRGP